MTPGLFLHQFAIGINAQNISIRIRLERNSQVYPVRKGLQIFIRCGSGSRVGQIDHRADDLSIFRSTQFQHHRAVRQPSLIAVCPDRAFHPGGHTAHTLHIHVNLFHFHIVLHNDIGPEICDQLSELKQRHGRTAGSARVSLHDILIHLEPPFDREVGTDRTQDIWRFPRQAGIRHTERDAFQTVRIKLRPAVSAGGFQRQIPFRVQIVIIGSPPGDQAFQRTRTLERNTEDIIRIRHQIRERCHQNRPVGDDEIRPLIGFSWIIPDPCSEIRLRHQIGQHHLQILIPDNVGIGRTAQHPLEISGIQNIIRYVIDCRLGIFKSGLINDPSFAVVCIRRQLELDRQQRVVRVTAEERVMQGRIGRS